LGNNILDSQGLNGHPFQKLKKRKTPVTIIVGLICDGSIILASDSQTSSGSSKRTDTNKISGVFFEGGDGALVAQSGNAELSSRAVEIFTNLAKATPINDYRKPAEVCEDTLRQLKQEVIRLNHWEDNRQFAHEYFQDPDNNFALMVAYYYGKEKPKPYIYILNFWPGIATRQYNYATMGCGATVAEFILNRSEIYNLDDSEAIITAIYTVEEVKKVDAFCGGDTKVGIISKKHGIRLSEGVRALALIKTTVDTISKYDQQTRAAWKAMMSTIITEAYTTFRKQYPKETEQNENE
jgi:20S proteasome alpha/beta subunit